MQWIWHVLFLGIKIFLFVLLVAWNVIIYNIYHVCACNQLTTSFDFLKHNKRKINFIQVYRRSAIFIWGGIFTVYK